MRAAPLPLALLLACAPAGSGDEGNPVSCDERLLSTGEVRARRMPCAAEAPTGGDGRAGDWGLENARVHFVIRGAYASLTRLGLAGGTVIDAAPAGGSDALVEATPTLDGLWFTEVQVSAWNEDGAAGLTLSGTLEDGQEATLDYRLAADGDHLEISPAGRLLVVPAPGSVGLGSTVELGADGLEPGEAPLLAADGALEDLGGWLAWEGAGGLWTGAREDVYSSLWPRGLDVSGVSEGDWVEASDGDGALLARLPVVDGAFSGRVPVEAVRLRASSEGYAPGEPSLPAEGLTLTLGEQGLLRVRVVDQDGADLPATLLWDGEPWPLPPGGGDLPLGPGAGTALVWAGPACEALYYGALTLSGVMELDATLACDQDAPLLADLGREGWPDPDEGRRAEDVLFAAAAEGVGYAVLVADDEVAPVAFDRHTADWLLAEQGSRAATDTLGALVAWPWSPDARDHAHGAADWPGIDADTLLNAMTRVADRIAVVEPAWVDALGSLPDLARPPRGLRLSGLADLDTYAALLDAWAPVAAVGPRTWIEGLPEAPSTVDVGAQLVAGATVATNGPRLTLRVDGRGPGERLLALQLRDVRLRVDAPSWMPLSGAALVGTGGVELARWTLSGGEPTRLDVTLADTSLPVGWVLAVVWGEEAAPPMLEEPAWAITSPVWIGRP